MWALTVWAVLCFACAVEQHYEGKWSGVAMLSVLWYCVCRHREQLHMAPGRRAACVSRDFWPNKCGLCVQALRAVAWHHEGKQFMCSHSDGSLTTWNTKMPHKAASVLMPHGERRFLANPSPLASSVCHLLQGCRGQGSVGQCFRTKCLPPALVWG